MNQKKKKKRMNTLEILNLICNLILNNNKISERKKIDFFKKILLVKIYQIYQYSIIIKIKILPKKLKKNIITLKIPIEYKVQIIAKLAIKIIEFKNK